MAHLGAFHVNPNIVELRNRSPCAITADNIALAQHPGNGFACALHKRGGGGGAIHATHAHHAVHPSGLPNTLELSYSRVSKGGTAPAPPWCTTAAHWGNSQSWGTYLPRSTSTPSGTSTPLDVPKPPQPARQGLGVKVQVLRSTVGHAARTRC